MTDFLTTYHNRRRFMVAASATSLIGLSGCASLPGFSLTDAIRRLLTVSSERAFTRMTAAGGFWDQQVGRIGLPDIMGTRGNLLAGVLTSAVFKNQLEGAFADVAVKGAARAAPLVAEAVRVVGIQAADQLVRGGPTAATAFMRGQLGTGLIEVMVPELATAIRLANDPVISQAISRLSGVDIAGVSNRFSNRINDAIWNEIGIEETAIRRDPQSTNDALLIGVFGLASRL